MVRGAPPADHGEGLTDPLLGDIQVLDADGRITRDLKCLGCGYNLRTLLQDGRCPECGQAVAEAVRLYLSSPRRWLDRMADGAGWLATGLGLIAVALSVMVFLAILDRWTAACMVPLLGLLGGLLAAVGAHGLTARRPSIASDDEDPTTRKLARVCMTLTIAGAVALVPTATDHPGPLVCLAAPALIAGVTALAVLPIALCGHAAAVMRHINRPDIVRVARLVLFVSAALEALIAVDVTAFLARFLGSFYWPQLPAFGGLAACFAQLLAMILLFVRTERALRRRIAELCAPGVDAIVAPGAILDTGRDDSPTAKGA